MISEFHSRKRVKLLSLFSDRLAIALINAAWYSAIMTHFFISLNRFCVFLFPISYNRIWSRKKAFIVGITCYSLGILLTSPLLLGKWHFVFYDKTHRSFFIKEVLCKNDRCRHVEMAWSFRLGFLRFFMHFCIFTNTKIRMHYPSACEVFVLLNHRTDST